MYAVGFYWTTWTGLSTLVPGSTLSLAFSSLCCEAVAEVAAAVVLPLLNGSRVGSLGIFLAGHLVAACCMALTDFTTGSTAVLVIGTCYGMGGKFCDLNNRIN